MEKKNIIILGVLGALILIFCAGLAMDPSANMTDVLLNKSQLNTSDAGTTHSITINCTGVDNHVRIYGMDYIPRGGVHEFDLEEGIYSLHGALVGKFATFEVTPSGVVTYDSLLEGSVLLGESSSNLTVVGYLISIDATDIDQEISLGSHFYANSFIGWTENGTTRTFSLIANTQLDYTLWGYLTHQFASFEVRPTGVINYDTSQVGIIEGNETNMVKAIAHSITIDATEIDQPVSLGSHWYEYSCLGWINPGTTRTFNLVVNGLYKYGLWSYFTHQFASFEVQPTSFITYDNANTGIIEGNETNTVKVVGHTIIINATDVDQKIGLGSWGYEYSFLGWTEPGTTRTYKLVVNGLFEYGLWAYYTHQFASFKVEPTGVINYDTSQVGIIEGNETNTVKVIGHSITIDATNYNERVSIGSWFYEYSLLGWVEPGQIKVINLAVNGIFNYGLWTDVSNVKQAEFTVFRNGTCSPNEFNTEYGIILVNSDYDDEPPVTEINLSGTTGNDEWYNSDVLVILTATDQASGVDRIEYSFDGANWIEYSGEILLDTEGITTFFYRSIDEAGNVETIKEISIKIDKTQPDTQLEMSTYDIDPLGDIYVSSSTEFSLNASDLTSGIETIYYRINSGDWCEYSSVFTLNSNGLYTIEYYCVDVAGNEETINSFTVNLVNFEVNSYLSKGENDPINYFDIIFTKSKQTGEYKLVATNPGQIFHITEVTNHWLMSIEALTIEVIIPDDFIMKGSEPIHVYLDGIDVTSDCVINGNLITLQNVPSGSAIKVVIHLDYALKGTVYANLDDFGMIGYLFETVVSGNSGVNGLEQSSQLSATIITHQKKTTAIAGYVTNTNGEFLEGLAVKLYQDGVLIGTTTTDENGFYYFIDIDEGDYEVHVLYDDSTEIQVAIASKNELEEVNFELSYDPL